MGTTNSCLPISINTWRPRGSTSKLKYDVQEAFHSQKNAININQASEDELLLLPGINRSLAFDIIQYRHVNDNFKQINEILRVDGLSSNIFKRICHDIVIDPPSSSAAKQEPVNLNFASYNELCSVPGLNPTLVQRIIQRRERKGSFQFVEDLLKIRGIDYIILATVRPHVTVHQKKIPTSISDYSFSNFQPSKKCPSAKDTLSLASILLETLPSELQTILIASPPHRPLMINDRKQTMFRFASWNLQELTSEKARNPGVREVICRVLLENNFSLIGIQDIGSKEALHTIVEELNNPTIPCIKDWPNRHQGKWNYTINDIPNQTSQKSDYLGFIYDESVGIEFKQSSSLSSNIYFSPPPLITLFEIYKKYKFVFVNIHCKSDKDSAEALSSLSQIIKNTIEQRHVVIFGGFNMPPTAVELKTLINSNYSHTIEQNTDITSKNPEGSTCADNIWLSSDAKALTTGNSGVIRDNLSSMWIPCGWTWGGLVSDHCPIWIEFDFS